ncbi:hypothetical protein O3P69_018590 [Scylla paramamosain]|uniref:Uncharacterized protein n=1 Tax=Scylla paramamosain TaxID=85552 RepID=A0AAW0T2Y5_SCYPA
MDVGPAWPAETPGVGYTDWLCWWCLCGKHLVWKEPPATLPLEQARVLFHHVFAAFIFNYNEEYVSHSLSVLQESGHLQLREELMSLINFPGAFLGHFSLLAKKRRKKVEGISLRSLNQAASQYKKAIQQRQKRAQNTSKAATITSSKDIDQETQKDGPSGQRERFCDSSPDESAPVSQSGQGFFLTQTRETDEFLLSPDNKEPGSPEHADIKEISQDELKELDLGDLGRYLVVKLVELHYSEFFKNEQNSSELHNWHSDETLDRLLESMSVYQGPEESSIATTEEEKGRQRHGQSGTCSSVTVTRKKTRGTTRRSRVAHYPASWFEGFSLPAIGNNTASKRKDTDGHQTRFKIPAVLPSAPVTKKTSRRSLPLPAFGNNTASKSKDTDGHQTRFKIAEAVLPSAPVTKKTSRKSKVLGDSENVLKNNNHHSVGADSQYATQADWLKDLSLPENLSITICNQVQRLSNIQITLCCTPGSDGTSSMNKGIKVEVQFFDQHSVTGGGAGRDDSGDLRQSMESPKGSTPHRSPPSARKWKHFEDDSFVRVTGGGDVSQRLTGRLLWVTVPENNVEKQVVVRCWALLVGALREDCVSQVVGATP